MMREGLCHRPPIVSRDRCRVVETLKAIRYKYVMNSNGMNEILPGLYLGNLKDSKDQQQLKKYGIEFIISAHRALEGISKTELSGRPKCKVLGIAINDNPAENIEQYFSSVCEFIHTARLQRKGVLVHCLMGVSRSCAFVAAYLLSVTQLEYENVLSFINSKRPMVNPNFGFRMQLYKYCNSPRRQEARERLTTSSDLRIDLFYADCHFINPQIDMPFPNCFRKKRSKSESDLGALREIQRSPPASSSTPNLTHLRAEDFPNMNIPFLLKSPQRKPLRASLPTFRYSKPT